MESSVPQNVMPESPPGIHMLPKMLHARVITNDYFCASVITSAEGLVIEMTMNEFANVPLRSIY
eukprot:scaffold1747_cov135-Skeletonema_menzelii.AAC.6